MILHFRPLDVPYTSFIKKKLHRFFFVFLRKTIYRGDRKKQDRERYKLNQLKS